MSDNNVVHAFSPDNGQALENIPHMLRYWADKLERDIAAGQDIELAAIVLMERGSCDPVFGIFGTPAGESHHPLYVSGVFDKCRAQMLTVGDE